MIATDYAVRGRIDLDRITTGVNDDAELVRRLQELGVDVGAIDAQLLAQLRSSFALKVVVRLPGKAPVTFTPRKGTTAATVDASAQILDTERIVLLAPRSASPCSRSWCGSAGALAPAPSPAAPARAPAPLPAAVPRRPVPHPHVPHPHLPHPHVPHPHLPGPPPPPRRKPPDGPAGSE